MKQRASITKSDTGEKLEDAFEKEKNKQNKNKLKNDNALLNIQTYDDIDRRQSAISNVSEISDFENEIMDKPDNQIELSLVSESHRNSISADIVPFDHFLGITKHVYFFSVIFGLFLFVIYMIQSIKGPKKMEFGIVKFYILWLMFSDFAKHILKRLGREFDRSSVMEGFDGFGKHVWQLLFFYIFFQFLLFCFLGALQFFTKHTFVFF